MNKLNNINWTILIHQWFRNFSIPATAIVIFLVLWSVVASQIQTSLGQLPGPAQVWQQTASLYAEHLEERNKEASFYERQDKRNAAKLKENPEAEAKNRTYTGKATFFDQIGTSILTVLTGFIVAAIIAIPVGIICGLNATIYRALNPLIQTFKPVSPLAWLPIVTMIVSAVYVSDDPAFSKSFINSAITVMLCTLWPIIINTTV
ncbi:MAG: ABC transporter permease, partial [Gammaproteobacteria bacterium]|nr:ABC transporter permease [Gammaproteobacteria bacterium]